MSASRPAPLAILALVVLSLIWGYNWVVMKQVIQYVDPFDFAAIRTLLGAMVLFLVLILTRRSMKIVALRQVAAGREPAYERTIAAFEAFNTERGAVWAALPWDEVWPQFVAVRRALVEVALSLDDAALARPFTAPWLSSTTAGGYLLDMAGHEQEHADALRPVLGLPALPRRLNRVAA